MRWFITAVIGTRYCSNNCLQGAPLQLLEFNDYDSESLKLQRNPNVTVRLRASWKKCTYCVQRISAVASRPSWTSVRWLTATW
ncbi:MAG: hypothetical protein R2911_25045 [Caldilineaceae bacterium]